MLDFIYKMLNFNFRFELACEFETVSMKQPSKEYIDTGVHSSLQA